MSLFLWYSKSSKETGEWLAKQLKISEHGTKPPRDFNGTVICWGANPSEKFKWEKRNFQQVYNDPRVIRPLLDRKLLLEKIAGVGLAVTKFIEIPKEAPQYEDLCGALDSTPNQGFMTCTIGGFKRMRVTSQVELDLSIEEEESRTRATGFEFAATERIRIYTAGGTIVGSSKFIREIPAETLAGTVSNKMSAGWGVFTEAQCVEVLQRAIDLKLIMAKGGTWAPFALSDATLRANAQTIAAILKFDFCAIDFALDGTVLNVITTPNLREVTTVQNAITNAISSWVYKNSRTPKDILLEVISESSSEEASSFLEELSNIKGIVKLSLKKDGAGKADEVTGGADSPPTKSA